MLKSSDIGEVTLHRYVDLLESGIYLSSPPTHYQKQTVQQEKGKTGK